MAVINVKKSFNLLRPVEQPPSFWEKIYFWMSGTCRIIIIVVSLVVIIVFGFRFILDRQANDLKTSIKDLNDAISSYKDDEIAIRALQSKTNAYSSIWGISSNITKMMPEIIKLVPSKLANLGLGINEKGFSLNGIATRGEISSIENILKTTPDLYKDVAVTSLKKVAGQTNQSMDVFEFAITADYTPELKRTSLNNIDNLTN